MRMFNGQPVPQTAANAGVIAIGAVGANTTAILTVACPGARVGDFVVVKPAAALEAGYSLTCGYCAVAGTVSVVAMNTTAGALPAAAQAFGVMCLPTA